MNHASQIKKLRLIAPLSAAAIALIASWPAAASPAVPSPLLLTIVAFTTPRAGVGLFTTGSGTTCQVQAGVTANGGARFSTPAHVASFTCGDAQPASSVTSDGRGDIFAYGPGLFVSHNGGRSFGRGGVPGQVVAVSAIGRSVWLLREHCPRLSGPSVTCALQLLRSANGGRTWHPSARQPGSGKYVLYLGSSLSTGPFSDQNWLVRTSLNDSYVLVPSSRARGGFPLWHTGNGGATWTRRGIPCRRDNDMLAAVPKTTALTAVCSSQPGSFPVPEQYKQVAVSANAGRTWAIHSPCSPNLNKDANCTLARGWLTGITAPTTRSLYTTAGYGSIRVGHNGGMKWRYLLPTAEIMDDTYVVQFFGPAAGLVFGYDHNILATIWHTADSGTHWTAIHPVIG